MRAKVGLPLIACLLASAAALAAGPTTPAVNSPLPTLGNLKAGAVNLAATGDQGTIAIPSWVTSYQITAISVSNCSATPVLAQLAIYTGAGATGTNVVAAGTITGATSAPVVLPMTLAGTVATTLLSASTLFIRVTVANSGALTCDVRASILDWS